MVTLVVNPGSSSKKYAFYKDNERLLTIRFEKTGEGFGCTTEVNGVTQKQQDVSVHIYREAFHVMLGVAKEAGTIQSVADLQIVAIRIVAPGTYFQNNKEIDESYIGKLIHLESVLPLHIPPILEEIHAIKKLLPDVKLVGVSDSAFHTTSPDELSAYSLRDAESLEIKRYGYHGLSVASVARQLGNISGGQLEKVVVAHIGSGVSVSALKNGVSMYNSMGYTPASGMMMGSRAGDMDPGAMIEVLRQTETKLSGGQRYLQTNGGFYGLLGIADIRVVLQREQRGDQKAATAMKMFLFDIQSKIMTAATALGGMDALVLTATAVERNSDLRARVVSGLDFAGIQIDEKKNDEAKQFPAIISPDNAKTIVAILATDEMGEIARLANEL